MSQVSRTRRPLWEELVIQGVALGGVVLSMRLCLKYLDPYKEQRALARKRAAFLKEHLGRDLQLIQELEAKVVVPMLRPELYRTTLWKPARGVLLYGPPGTGKTMLAKSLAKHSGCYFLNITASSIMSKWLGDANRLVRAIFSLASKLQPCIIFIALTPSTRAVRHLREVAGDVGNTPKLFHI
ncbi:P-loop containing nucleoside triphosphate hydrolase protein [Dunaliella salina]|uniref:P-loop containing nucleoside triphosphate hydrolase protein n=1 Tax=Dunaliella salina TaxID=3046 RepID=A0ABQ7H6B4_DUNSA|nr:P-loop containing nucleoside triphosphate hydrolase protein [Dunaliella salina]|eukprot:KAF5842399.1 P-loop containing nucleoside triphosphate hydrolase protein [Dunaliella salina]